MKIILDTNVLIAAFSSNGICSLLFELCINNYEIIISDFILNELSRNLKQKLKLPETKILEITTFLKEHCKILKYEKFAFQICRDKSDDEILALSKSCNANYLITGDKDLLVLNKYENIMIINPRQFWEIIKEEK